MMYDMPGGRLKHNSKAMFWKETGAELAKEQKKFDIIEENKAKTLKQMNKETEKLHLKEHSEIVNKT
jgi:hypothetical protein